MDKQYSFEDFRNIISKLRGEDGCPWDKEQTHDSLIPCMINETAEAVAAVSVYRQTGDSENLCEELGDMLLQVMLQSQIAEEEGIFTIADVISGISQKMVRRHPHVFAKEDAKTSKEVLNRWEEIKKFEKAGRTEQTENIKVQALVDARKEMAEYLSQ